MKARLDARAKVLDACRIPDVKRIRDESLKVGSTAFQVNAGGWAFYMVPLLACQNAIRKVTKLMRGLVLLPETEVARVLPESTPRAAKFRGSTAL